ncbi:fimbrial protein [Serinibacter arcticus]|uniref:Fimbrial protein n=1 Tax=Serinibacter arcticus TaxID=1655435 RepID=A0A2U1ZWQ9_9MICO|nr:SpaH/EbpB family LPXTG-anchored major pilin [Serinibacter arcticus]PWD51380.1 fimbrial protein [Serinibacter arcticus]
MTTTTRTRTRRVSAAALAGAVLLAVGLGTAAVAAPVIEEGTVGSLTVHKFQAPDTLPDLPNDGSEITEPIDALPLAGAQFTIYEVEGIDLTENQGWQDAAALEGTFDPATVLPGSVPATAGAYTLTQVGQQTTSATGVAAFTGLPIALYLVVESSTPTGFTPVPSFMVTVPLTLTAEGATEQAWEYDVHVYPKNPSFTATKTVADAIDQEDAVVGDQIVYTVTGDIPAQGLDAYRIADTLATQLTYAPDDTQSDIVLSVSGSAGETLTFGTDYTVAVAGQTLTVDLTAAGLATVAEAKSLDATAQVVMALTVTVNAPGEISNTANVFPSAAAIANVIPTVTPAVVSKWGSVAIAKTSSDTTITALGGATFEVYYTTGSEWDGDPDTATQVDVNGVTTWTTTATGTVTIGALRYSDWANGAEVPAGADDFRQYWLVETVALAGHELLAEPVGFLIEDLDETTTTPTVAPAPIVNVPSNAGFELPFTGGIGTVWFTVAGVLLLGGATLLVVRQRRRTQA